MKKGISESVINTDRCYREFVIHGACEKFLGFDQKGVPGFYAFPMWTSGSIFLTQPLVIILNYWGQNHSQSSL